MFFSLERFLKLLLFIVCFVCFTASAFVTSAIDLPGDAIILEAEAGNMDKGVTPVEQDGASGGVAIDSAAEAKTLHEIVIPKAGRWYIWVRLWCPDGNQDSYWFGMDDATPFPDDGGGQIRIYSAVGDSVNTGAQPFNLWFWDFGKENTDPHSYFDVNAPGTYTFWSKGREPGTLLDQILLTMDENFSAEKASNGEAIEILKAVHPEGRLVVTWAAIRSSVED